MPSALIYRCWVCYQVQYSFLRLILQLQPALHCDSRVFYFIRAGKIHAMTPVVKAVLRVFQCRALEQRAVLLKQQEETRVSELERKLTEQQQQTDTAEEVSFMTSNYISIILTLII